MGPAYATRTALWASDGLDSALAPTSAFTTPAVPSGRSTTESSSFPDEGGEGEDARDTANISLDTMSELGPRDRVNTRLCSARGVSMGRNPCTRVVVWKAETMA